MKLCYLEVTYHHGRALAAYYHLPRHESDRSARTESVDGGFLVDFASDGRPIGIEILSPAPFELEKFNALLTRLGQPKVSKDDVAPLVAA